MPVVPIAPDTAAARSRHYEVIARAIAFIRSHARSQPTLEAIAAAVHLSPYHLQRLFADWAGISPKRFLQYLTKEYAKELLLQVFPQTPVRGAVHLILRGTNFQIKVWEALIHTEFGRVVSYRQLARQAGVPKAQRAVGSALAANTIAFLIPCHRVIRESGETGNYRWGPERKLALLGWEACNAR